jgi:hypothetical protein
VWGDTIRLSQVWSLWRQCDLHVYDPAGGAWTDLSAALSGTPPSPRSSHGFTSAGGKLYVHGGWGFSGEGETVLAQMERCMKMLSSVDLLCGATAFC